MGSSPAYSLRALPRREDARTPLSHFRYPLLAAFAVLLLGAAAASPPDVAASSEPDAADTITTALYPGWNLVGWLGPGTPTSELFDAIPALRQVSAWDAEAQAYQHVVRRRYGDLADTHARYGALAAPRWLLDRRADPCRVRRWRGALTTRGAQPRGLGGRRRHARRGRSGPTRRHGTAGVGLGLSDTTVPVVQPGSGGLPKHAHRAESRRWHLGRGDEAGRLVAAGCGESPVHLMGSDQPPEDLWQTGPGPASR